MWYSVIVVGRRTTVDRVQNFNRLRGKKDLERLFSLRPE
jgi:hypothetical protein